jgi:hypothetical protein
MLPISVKQLYKNHKKINPVPKECSATFKKSDKIEKDPT